MGLILMDRAMLSKSLIQFSVDGWGCVSSLLSDLGPNYGGGHEGNGDFLQQVPCRPCPCTQSPTLQQATVNPCLCQRLLDTHRQVWASLWVTAPFSLVLVCTRCSLCPPRVYFPVLCKFWQLCGGLSGDLLQEGLCHVQGCCTQSPCPVAAHC